MVLHDADSLDDFENYLLAVGRRLKKPEMREIGGAGAIR